MELRICACLKPEAKNDRFSGRNFESLPLCKIVQELHKIVLKLRKILLELHSEIFALGVRTLPESKNWPSLGYVSPFLPELIEFDRKWLNFTSKCANFCMFFENWTILQVLHVFSINRTTVGPTTF